MPVCRVLVSQRSIVAALGDSNRTVRIPDEGTCAGPDNLKKSLLE